MQARHATGLAARVRPTEEYLAARGDAPPPGAPAGAQSAVRVTTRNLSQRQFDMSTTIDLRGDLRTHIRRSAFLDGKCPTSKTSGPWCVLALEGLPSTNQPLSPNESVTRYYVIVPSEIDALLADGLRPGDIRVYARDVRIR